MTSLSQRASAHVALVTMCSFIVSTALPPLQARAVRQAPAAPAPAKPATAKPATAKPAPGAPAPAAAAAAQPPDGGWPRDYVTPSGGSIRIFQPQIASWSDQKHLTGYAAVSYSAKGADKPALGTVKIEADTQVALGERLVNFSTVQDHRVELSDAAEGPDAGGHRRGRQDRATGGSRDRARSRPGQPRQEPDPAEERGGCESRPAGHLLQHDTGAAREPRWRSDLEPDQGQRSQVRRQHQLGSVPARADQDVLPAPRPVVARRDRVDGAVETGGNAARQLRQAARRGQLERSEGQPSRQDALVVAAPEGVRQHEAGGVAPAARCARATSS